MLAGCVAACLLAGVVGAVFTAGSVDGWYGTIAKPAWTPPNWVFGPVWTVLYLMMGVAAWLVARRGWRASRTALAWFVLQLLLNIGWYLVFFGLRSPGWALPEIGILWIAIVATILAFARHSRPAAALLIPYLGWSTFAAALNGAIWLANRHAADRPLEVDRVVRVSVTSFVRESAAIAENNTTSSCGFDQPDREPSAVDEQPVAGQQDRAQQAAEKRAVAEAARYYYRTLAALAPQLPNGERRFAAFVQAAFRLAHERSTHDDAIRQNRAALIALGALMGDRRVGGLVGQVATEAQRKAAERTAGQVTLRGRPDWAWHFCLSAAITATSSEAASNQLGLMKERMDMRSGGSGFSFADLLADRAGTRLAVAATRDEAAARSIQERLARGFTLDDIFPAAADLPEGLSEADLKSRYGGIGGPGYKELLVEIERRLDGCAALNQASTRPR
ncbi:MAG: tryptophan-rich sensory protein [Pirellulales bacterium]|nr:tryptophan-rich sensory protein [Pirellulales bacterium]